MSQRTAQLLVEEQGEENRKSYQILINTARWKSCQEPCCKNKGDKTRTDFVMISVTASELESEFLSRVAWHAP